MTNLKTLILDSLYKEYGQLTALAERTSHDTRIAYRYKANGMLKAIVIVEAIVEAFE